MYNSNVGSEHQYMPKGGMCITCTKIYEICNALEFKNMPAIGTTAKGKIIVRCTAHVHVVSNTQIKEPKCAG